MSPDPGMYAPLLAKLAELPAQRWSTWLTFPEIEALIGRRLPVSARYDWYWMEGPVARKNWTRAGFSAALGYRTGHYGVAFTRLPKG